MTGSKEIKELYDQAKNDSAFLESLKNETAVGSFSEAPPFDDETEEGAIIVIVFTSIYYGYLLSLDRIGEITRTS